MRRRRNMGRCQRRAIVGLLTTTLDATPSPIGDALRLRELDAMRKARDAATAEKDEAEEREADVGSPPSPGPLTAPHCEPFSVTPCCLLLFLSSAPPCYPLPPPLRLDCSSRGSFGHWRKRCLYRRRSGGRSARGCRSETQRPWRRYGYTSGLQRRCLSSRLPPAAASSPSRFGSVGNIFLYVSISTLMPCPFPPASAPSRPPSILLLLPCPDFPSSVLTLPFLPFPADRCFLLPSKG